jgi:hypothetical protein
MEIGSSDHWHCEEIELKVYQKTRETRPAAIILLVVFLLIAATCPGG